VVKERKVDVMGASLRVPGVVLAGILACVFAAKSEPSQSTILSKGDCVALVGDSITEQKMYSRFIEDYLVACVPELELRVVQLGWGGEQATGFLERMTKDLFRFKPDVVTLCYGMNDAHYTVYEEPAGETYKNAMTEIVEGIQGKGAKVIVGSPGIVDGLFARPDISFETYNETLSKFAELAAGVAQEQDAPFADLYTLMQSAKQAGVARYGDSYFMTYDGIHPKLSGHLAMTYGFLKAMGLSGEIGTIEMTIGGSASSSPGHRVLSFDGGRIEIESTKYPFCFYGDDVSPDSARSALPLLPFNEGLNRLMLVVRELPAEEATVSWGATSKTFTRGELEGGVNLAAAFPENPFSSPFEALDAAVMRKQVFETAMIKEFDFARIAELLGDDPELARIRDTLDAKFMSKHTELQKAVRAAVVPLRHSIEVAYFDGPVREVQTTSPE